MGERLRQARTIAGRGVRTVAHPRGLRGAVVEMAWTAAHLAMYPAGVWQERSPADDASYSMAGLAPLQRGLIFGDVEAAGTPIVLLHGLVDNRTIFTVLKRHLRRRGFGRIRTINYPVLTHDVRAAAENLGEVIEQLCAETGYERVHVIGHSLGGIVARYYVQCLGGDSRVHTLVCLGSPHTGTKTAWLLPTPVVRQLRPGSDVLTELAAPAPRCRTRLLCFWSDLDQLMVPKRSARLEHPDLRVRNVFVRAVGHLSLPIDRRVVHEICNALAFLDVDGATITAPVASLHQQRERHQAPPTVARSSQPGSSVCP